MFRYARRLKPYSRSLRKNMTDAEMKLWERIRRKQLCGAQFYRQKPLGGFIVDFFCPQAKLVIELDGGQHYTATGRSKDVARDCFFVKSGLRVFRFSDREIFEELEGVLEKIHAYLSSQISPSPSFLKRGEAISSAEKKTPVKFRVWLLMGVVFLFGAGPVSPVFAQTSPESRAPSPQRIVSLSTVTTEELFLLGEGQRVVGRSHFCVRPAEVLKVPEAGNIVEVHIEKIVSLVPDLVIVTPMIDPRAVAKMKTLGLRVETFAPAKDFRGVGDSFLRLARMIGREAEAVRIIEAQAKAVEQLRRKVPPGPPVSVFLEVGAEPLVTVTRDSFLNDLIEFAGGRNIAATAERPLYSREKVLAQDPDMIIISSMGFDGAKEKQMWEKYPELKAARTGRIVFVNSDLFCSPTPVTFTRALETMIGILHGHSVP